MILDDQQGNYGDFNPTKVFLGTIYVEINHTLN